MHVQCESSYQFLEQKGGPSELAELDGINNVVVDFKFLKRE